jgi:hypothetical protein
MNFVLHKNSKIRLNAGGEGREYWCEGRAASEPSLRPIRPPPSSSGALACKAGWAKPSAASVATSPGAASLRRRGDLRGLRLSPRTDAFANSLPAGEPGSPRPDFVPATAVLVTPLRRVVARHRAVCRPRIHRAGDGSTAAGRVGQGRHAKGARQHVAASAAKKVCVPDAGRRTPSGWCESRIATAAMPCCRALSRSDNHRHSPAVHPTALQRRDIAGQPQEPMAEAAIAFGGDDGPGQRDGIVPRDAVTDEDAGDDIGQVR